MTHSELLRFLRTQHYREAAEIQQSADFLVLGDTISLWPVGQPNPFRLHYFGEELEKVEERVGQKWQVAPLPELSPNSLRTEHGEIRPGEYVVHPNHGVGRFEFISTRDDSVVGERRSYISLEYAGNDRLLFPLDRQAELMPYIGTRHPRLTRLYSKSWQNTKERVQKNLIQVARELMKIYAMRQLSPRPVYPENQEWEAILAKEAGFELTSDQKQAMHEISQDLHQKEQPMDRLLCGDVGYGKTEVALRTAAQVMASGKQVALIAPTTVLAEQHFALLQKRFAALPVRVEHLSRLTVNREKEILAKLAAGQVDLLVGTHRLLGKDVQYANLGMLILDEEQKFGVAQKECLKELRPQIDVLSLSATPIPRTLSMSLSGLRGLSILRSAPHGRLPVETVVLPYSEQKMLEAVLKELERGGQVYLVYNRVGRLPILRKRLMELLKERGIASVNAEEGEGKVRLGIAHGQADELHLAKTMSEFLGGSIQVLVASSIVEHGLDSPGANTLIVVHSEWFGLSDLYQLRGRVGRRQVQAHAYFMTGGIEGVDQKLNETAERRMQALLEADELGSGWSVALRDLEIRGGGNLLGHEQHGSMEAIGLLLYAQLLQEEIGRQARRLSIPLFQK